jgi:uncharacterized protein (TIGR02996 family)
VSEDEAFLTAIRDSPGDETLRLVYADWLEERADPRAAYLRAEVEHFRNEPDDIRDSPAWALREGVEPVWRGRVSRAPFGVLMPGLAFSACGPKVTSVDLKVIEARWQAPLPPDYAAFLLCFNGGCPSKPYLYSYGEYGHGRAEFYDQVQFFSTEDRHPCGQPYLLLSVIEAYGGQVRAHQDAARLARLMPVGTVDLGEGNEAMLAMRIGGDEYPQVTTVTSWDGRGVSEDDNIYQADSFVGLLMQLREGGPAEPVAAPDPAT